MRSKKIILFLHGFLGCKEDFETLISFLPEYRCIALDYSSIEDITTAVSGKVHVVGYSMGGRIALQLSDRFEKIILLSTHPGIKDKEERETRVKHDLHWAERLETLPFQDFLDLWYKQPIFDSLRENRSLYQNTIKKRCKPSKNWLREFSTGSTPYHETFSSNILFLYGEKDLKFSNLCRNLPAQMVTNSGHAMHLENPSECAEKIRNFIECGNYKDIKYHKSNGIAKITINRPEVRNAFRPLTVREMSHALNDAREDQEIGVIILTGEGKEAFCSGGDQKIRGEAGYSDQNGMESLNVLDFQRQIRTCPKPVVAMVAGFAIGGGHVLHIVCDLTIAADNAIFGQVGPKVGSFDGGFGSSYLARLVGQKKAREIWFLCRRYTAQEALQMGLVNCVVPYEELEETTIGWCEEMLQHSPLALRCLKSALNADCDGQTGLQELAGNATMLYYMSEEAQEGHQAFLEKRKPDFTRFPKRP